MKFTGTVKTPMIDIETGKTTAIFALNEDFREAYEEFKDCDKITLEIKKYRRKRSLDANAYYWVLITKFAKVLHLSNSEAHNIMLSRYGQPETFGGQCTYITIPDTEEAEKKVRESETYHLKATSQVREGNDGVMYRTYRLQRGSSTYNTEEMARLIDGLVDCCIEAGISKSEIASPEEARLLKERYGVEIG